MLSFLKLKKTDVCLLLKIVSQRKFLNVAVFQGSCLGQLFFMFFENGEVKRRTKLCDFEVTWRITVHNNKQL